MTVIVFFQTIKSFGKIIEIKYYMCAKNQVLFDIILIVPNFEDHSYITIKPDFGIHLDSNLNTKHNNISNCCMLKINSIFVFQIWYKKTGWNAQAI